MSNLNSSSRIDLSCINDEDLNLDLDDDEPIRPLLTDSNNNKKDDHVFKMPEPVTERLDESITDGFQNNCETTLDNLFDDEDEEDFLIRTQPMFSSTQTSKPRELSPQKIDNEIFINTQSTSVLMKKRHDETIEVENPDENLNDISLWKHAQSDLCSRMSKIGLDSELVKKYTLDYYYKKFFDYSLLRISENGLRKLPILCVWIKEISRNDRNSNATVTLTDGVDSIKGTISKQITVTNWELLHIGSVMLLQNVCLLRVNYAKNGYHLNINKPNLLMLYHKKDEKKISRSEFNEFRSDNIKEFIDFFEKTYVFIDTSLIKLNNSVNKTLNVTNNTSVNKPPNRPAPYQVPPQYNKTKPVDKVNPNRNYNFNRNVSNPNLNNVNNNQNKMTRHNSDVNVMSGNVIHSSQKEVSDDMFSQLIFGIEDELLKEDD